MFLIYRITRPQERELINEIGNVMCRTLCQLNEQLNGNKRMKYQLEENWSNKNQSFKIDAINLGLNIQSPYIMSHDDVHVKLSEKYKINGLNSIAVFVDVNVHCVLVRICRHRNGKLLPKI